MRGRPAKILSGADLRRVLSALQPKAYGDRNIANVLLSLKPACGHVRSPDYVGATSPILGRRSPRSSNCPRKQRSGAAVGEFRFILIFAQPFRSCGAAGLATALWSSPAAGESCPPDSIVNWFTSVFKATRLQGCSSHSGRRTFITLAARRVSLLAARSAMSNSGLDTGRYRRRRATSTATNRLSAVSSAFSELGNE